jgi:hypothetical protein
MPKESFDRLMILLFLGLHLPVLDEIEIERSK